MRTHLIDEINYGTGVPDSQAPTTCTCDWEGLYQDFAQHRADATAADRAAAQEGVTMAAPSEPTAKQQEAWELVKVQGLSQVEAADRLQITQAGVQGRLRGYMERKGIGGSLPGYSGGVSIRFVTPEPRATAAQPATTSAPTVRDVEAAQGAASPAPDAEPAPDAVPTVDGAGSGHHIRDGVSAAGGTAAPLSPEPGSARSEAHVRQCVVCGCTEERACEGGCGWVDDPEGLGRDICSSCVDAMGDVYGEVTTIRVPCGRCIKADVCSLRTQLDRLESEAVLNIFRPTLDARLSVVITAEAMCTAFVAAAVPA